MKVSLKRRLNLFPKLRRRLSSVKWILLLVTTAMFFLSASSSGCSFNIAFGGPPGTGPSVVGPQPSQSALPPVGGGSGSPPAVGGGSPPPSGGKKGSPVGGKKVMVTIQKGTPTATDPSGFVFVDSVTKTNVTNINKGDTVIWTNNTKVNHTVTDDKGSFDSGDFAPGSKPFMHTFTTAGTVTYNCQDHPGQVGTIKVT